MFIKVLFSFTLLLTIIVFIGCKNDSESCNDVIFDKQVRLRFDGGVTTSDTVFQNSPFYSNLVRFNIDYYVHVDSVIFSTLMSTEDTTVQCFVDLYNYTDGVAISNSEISTNSKTAKWINSKNLLNELPQKEVTLIARVKSGKKFTFVSQSISYLFIYRH